MTLQVGAVHIPLQTLLDRLPERESRLRPPRIGAPKLEDEFELKPMRDIAVREMLAHANSGTARVHLPLSPALIKKGPFKIEIPAEAEAIIDLSVVDGRIKRGKEHTKGNIEPDIGLPLGLKVRGIYLDEDDGSIIADIAKFPDINLSWLNVAKLRIPATLDGLLAMLFDRAERAASASEARAKTLDDELSVETEEEERPPSLAVELGGLRVEARSVTPRDEEVALGPLGALTLGPQTRLDVDYSAEALVVRGTVDINGANLSGAGFSVRGLEALGEGTATLTRTDEERRLRLEYSCHEASCVGASVRLLDGSRFELGPSRVEDLAIAFERSPDGVHWEISSRKLNGRLAGGTMMMFIAGKAHPIQLAEMDVEGALKLSDRYGFELDAEVKGAHMAMESLALPLGVLDLETSTIEAVATGRLSASRKHYSFAGSLAISTDMKNGSLLAGPVRAEFLDETNVNLTITRFSGAETLDELEGNGTLELRLASGAVPLGEGAAVTFSHGTTGTLALHAIRLESGATWPTIEAGAQVSAEADPFEIPGVARFRGGTVHAEVPSITMHPAGDLALADISVSLALDEDA